MYQSLINNHQLSIINRQSSIVNRPFFLLLFIAGLSLHLSAQNLSLLGRKTYTEDLTKFKLRLSRAPLGTNLGPLPVLTPAAAPPAADAGIFTIISGFVARMKASQNYTEAIGEDLGIIGDESDFDALTYKPEIKGKSVPGGARVTFTKKGVDGIDFQSRPKGSTTWEKLAFDSQSPYIDTRPPRSPGVPEEREYRGRGVISDVEIGEWSDIISVTVTE